MSRGGRGGGGGRSRGGGSHSSSRGGGGRPSSRGSHGRSSSSYSSHSYSSHRSYDYGYGGGYGYRSSYSGGGSMSPGAVICIFIIFAVVLLVNMLTNTDSSTKNYVERIKLESGNGFMTDCVKDNSDLFINETRMESHLKEFYEKTGVQPVVVTDTYKSSVNSDADAFDWGVQYYDNNIDREDCFLVVYLDAKNINNRGYTAVVTGYQADSVMDSGAIEIFWNYLDRYWADTSLEFDTVFVKAINNTGESIMTVHKTTNDIVFILVGAFIVVVVGVVVIVVFKTKRKMAKEKAESDERILNADLSKSKIDDPTLSKYE